MRRLIATLCLLSALTGCRVLDQSRDRTLMYEPWLDGGPVEVERGPF